MPLVGMGLVPFKSPSASKAPERPRRASRARSKAASFKPTTEANASLGPQASGRSLVRFDAETRPPLG